MSHITELTATELCRALRDGEVSSQEATQAFLARIDHLNPSLNVFLSLSAEKALQSAQNADRELVAHRKAGETPSPLLGIPLAVKDVLCVEGLPCTCGSKILEKFIPPFTATSIDRLQKAGVVILGKTNMDEFAMGSSTENSAYGPTRNPWNPEYVPGGSSGGSAAAVVARMVPVAVGTDTGGSVRQPAAFCGLTGLKPTYGRVSRYGLVAYGSSLDTVGVLARSASDVAMLFTVMAGHDPLDATTMDQPVRKIDFTQAGLSGLRVGVPDEYFIAGIQPEVEVAVKAAIDRFRSLGAEIVSIRLPHTEYALPVYYLIAPSEASANLARYDGVRFGLRASVDSLEEMFSSSRGKGFGPEVKRRIMLGTYALSAGYYDAYYGQAQKVRTLIKQDFDRAFEKVDVIAAPVTPSTAFKLGEHTNDPLAMYLEDIFTLPANLAGVPGLAFPVGFDRKGLPIGMQVMGSPFQEDVLFRVAHAYQQVTDWHLHKPPLISEGVH